MKLETSKKFCSFMKKFCFWVAAFDFVWVIIGFALGFPVPGLIYFGAIVMLLSCMLYEKLERRSDELLKEFYKLNIRD